MRTPQHACKRSLLVLALWTAASAHALDLLETWERARTHDAQMAVVQATRGSAQAFQAQAGAVWRPRLLASATAGLASARTDTSGAQFSAPGFGQSNGVSFGTSIHQGTSTRWSLSAKQALYNPERDAQKAQLEKTAEMAELRADSAQQTLMLETVQRYFDVVLAERKLSVLQQQHSAVTRALTQAQDRFAIGDIPITDTHEAAARASGLQAQVLAAESDLLMARVVLSESTGLTPAALNVMQPQVQASQDAVQDLMSVLAQAQDNNVGLRTQQAAVSMAQHEVRKHSLQASAALDAVATVGHERLSGSGDFGNAANTQSQQMIGLSLTIPLYTGGWREGKLKESLSAQDKASAELELMRVQVGQQTRRAWLTLHSGQAQISAHMEAVKAHRARLDATRLGRQVGDRTTQELLNAENDAAHAELALLAAQTLRLYQSLTLEALTGSLSVQSLARVNAQLAP